MADCEIGVAPHWLGAGTVKRTVRLNRGLFNYQTAW